MSRRRGLQQCSPGTARRVYARSAGSSTLGPWRPTARCAGCPAGGCRVCGVFFAINCFSRDFRSYYNLLPSYGSTPLTTRAVRGSRAARVLYTGCCFCGAHSLARGTLSLADPCNGFQPE